jgi:Xaa-Pro aminopeptidase
VADPRRARLAAVVEALLASHLDALLVTGASNTRYLTGFSGSSALVVVTPTATRLITDFRYKTQVVDEVGSLAQITIEPVSLWTGLWQQLDVMPHVRQIGFESAHVQHRDFQRLLESGSKWRWTPTVDVVERLRERKDADELEHIRRAANVATTALGRTLPLVHPGMTELEAAGVLEHALRDAGSEGFPFATIVAAGVRSALPHARATSHRVREGDFLLFDFGAVVDGYCSDVTRTVIVGRANDQQKEFYEVVQQANALAARQVRAGMTGRDADAIARSYIAEQGLEELFGHGLGHGIGLDVHEAPRLARTNEQPLGAGAVVTVEPGIYRPGWGGVRIEDDVWLGEHETRVLTDFPRELLELV